MVNEFRSKYTVHACMHAGSESGEDRKIFKDWLNQIKNEGNSKI
jgi:hypothetical protein